MNESPTDAVIDELIGKAVSHLEPAWVQVGDALENLEHREVLGAIAAIMGCEAAISRANHVLAIAGDYAEKLARARAVASETNAPPASSGSAVTEKEHVGGHETRDAALEVFLPDAEFGSLPSVTLIASGYEFDCPSCETHNTLIAIPKHGKAVECHNCHARFKVDEARHAHD